jgi:hypothetical protein
MSPERHGTRGVVVGTVSVVPWGLMYLLRGEALQAERGDGREQLDRLYSPGTVRQARRRLLTVWGLCLTWPLAFVGFTAGLAGLVLTLVGMVLALSTQFEPAWAGNPVRVLTRLALVQAVAGVIVVRCRDRRRPLRTVVVSVPSRR